MFTTDAFGQRVLRRPTLRYIKTPPGGGGGGGKNEKKSESAEGVELDGETFDFPTSTAVADMTPEQAAEYWRHQAKKQQKLKGTPPADYEELRQKAARLEKLETKKLPKEQRTHQRELEDARRDGENIGAAKYLKPAIEGRFQAITGIDEEETAKIFAHLDVSTFVTDAGEIDVEAIKEYASTHGSAGAGGGHGPDPVRDSVRRQRPAGNGGGGQSMQERREATRERLAKKKTTTT